MCFACFIHTDKRNIAAISAADQRSNGAARCKTVLQRE